MQLHVDAASSDQLSDLQQKQKDLQQQKQELAKQQAQTNQKLASLKADKEKQLEYKNTLDEQMENLQKPDCRFKRTDRHTGPEYHRKDGANRR